MLSSMTHTGSSDDKIASVNQSIHIYTSVYTARVSGTKRMN